MTQEISILRSVGGLTFDATFFESHESELEISDNPVESGVTVSDHAFMLPLTLTIEAGVSDTPLVSFANDPYASGVSRSRRAYELIQILQKTAEPFNVVTGLKTYSNMICKTIRTQQDKDSSNSLIFTAELREVIIVSTQSVRYPQRRSGKTTQQASKTQQKGKITGSPIESGTTSQTAKRQSLAKKLKTMLN